MPSAAVQDAILARMRVLESRLARLEKHEYVARAGNADSADEIADRTLDLPIESFGVWNGNFDTGDFEDWTVTEQGSSTTTVDASGKAGNYCVKSGQSGSGQGGYIVMDRYLPVDEDADYLMTALIKGSSASTQIIIKALCYNAAQTYLSAVTLYSGTPGTSWVRVEHRLGPNGDIAMASGTYYVKLAIYLSEATLTNSWGYADDIQFSRMQASESALFNLDHDTAQDNTQHTFTTAGGYSSWSSSGSLMNLTLTEPGYIWYSYHWSGHNSAIRAAVAVFAGYIDGSQQDTIIMGQGVASSWQNMSTGLVRSTASVAAGAHTIDLRVYRYNADTLTLKFLRGACFWTRAN